MMWNTMSVPIRRPRTVSESLAYPEPFVAQKDNLAMIIEEDRRSGSFGAFGSDSLFDLEMRSRASSQPNRLPSRRSTRTKPTAPLPPEAQNAVDNATADTEEQTEEETETEPRTPDIPEVTLRHRDFCPRRINAEDEQVQYESYSSVMKRANQWLADHADAELVTVETITWSMALPGPGKNTERRMRSPSELIKRGNQWLAERRRGTELLVNETATYSTEQREQLFTDSSVTHRSLNEEEHNKFYRGIRFWYFSRGEKFWQSWAPKRRVTFRDYVPSTSDDMFAVIKTINHHIREKPITGHVLRVETLCVPAEVPSTTSVWDEDPTTDRRYGTVVRLIYVVFEGAKTFNAEIGIRDFCPHSDNRASSNLGLEKYEDIFGRAARWLFQQKNLHVVNLQTVPVKIKSDVNPESLAETELWQHTNHQEHGSKPTEYMLLLRVAFWRLPSDVTASTLPPRLSYRTAAPRFTGRPSNDPERMFLPEDFEETEVTVEVVNKWLHKSQGRLVGLETVPVRCHSAAQGTLGPEATILRNVTSAQSPPEPILYCVRIYLDGDYRNIRLDRKWRSMLAAATTGGPE